MHLHSRFQQHLRLGHTYAWAVLMSFLIVAVTAALARATLNLAGALTYKPDIAVLLLLPDEKITGSKMLRKSENERDYLIETKEGPKLAKLKRGEKEWYLQQLIPLHEGIN